VIALDGGLSVNVRIIRRRSRRTDTASLWEVASPDMAIAFDRRANVGLHHLALAVADWAGLDALYQRVSGWPDVVVEFAPQPSGSGPKVHFVVYEPSGVRVEFTFDPRLEAVRRQGSAV
jgi:hypothetical protein